MKKLLFSFLLIAQSHFLNAQLLTDITDVCGENSTVNNGNSFFIISELCRVANVKNDFYLIPCKNITHCNAFQKNSKKYIFYNPEFIRQLRNFGLGLTVDDINTKFTEWEAVASFAHEISHHLCGHLPVENCKLSKHEMELQADEYAGYLLYKLNASLTQSQKLFNTKDFPINQTVDYPARLERLKSVKRGFENASNQLLISIKNNIIVYNQTSSPTQDENNKLSREYYQKAIAFFNSGDNANSVIYLQKASDLNNPNALFDLGNYYYNYQKNYSLAFANWNKASNLNNSNAKIYLALLYQNGYGVEKNEYKSFKLNEEAANMGNSSGQAMLGNCYIYGIGVDKNYNKGIEYLDKAIEQGNLTAKAIKGYEMLFGENQNGSKEKGLSFIKEAAYQNECRGEYFLANYYFYGDYEKQDIDSAIYWYKKNYSDHGNNSKETSYALGKCYLSKLNIVNIQYLTKDEYENAVSESKKWLDIALSEGNYNAYSLLGRLYLVSYIVKKTNNQHSKADFKIVEEYYSKALNVNRVVGLIGLGDINFAAENKRKAWNYYQEAKQNCKTKEDFQNFEVVQNNQIEILKNFGFKD